MESTVARSSLRLLAVNFEVREASDVASFWAELLCGEVVAEERGALVPGEGAQIGLRFVEADTEERTAPNRLHLHLTSTDLDDQMRTVTRVEALGGRIIRQQPEEGYVVMADPGRNEFCVIEPDSQFLAGAGFLAEATDHGPPEAGRFWSEALGWPLVWDRGNQTAIQSPRGGTKLSWDVRTDRTYGTKRQWFETVADDLAGEVERLMELGATHLGERVGSIVMADPGGNEFTISPG